MALEFTYIKDAPGAAIYFIHDGTTRGEQDFTKLIEDVKTRTEKQCVLLSARDNDGSSIIRFYQLRGSHFVIIVRDNDQLHHVWSNGERLDAVIIAFTAEQAG